MRRDARALVQELREPFLLLFAILGDRDEIVRAADDRTQGDRDDVD
jgi:hypothetical protein